MSGSVHTDAGVSDDLLMKTITRFDFYIGTTNAKAALVTAFNTFAVGTVVLKWGEILAPFDGHQQSAKVVAFLLAIAALASLTSLAAIFIMVKPYLQSPKAPGTYHSLFFFEHVAEHPDEKAYLAAVRGADSTTISADLAAQAFALARGVRNKFRLMNTSVVALVVEIGAFAGILILKLWLAVFA